MADMFVVDLFHLDEIIVDRIWNTFLERDQELVKKSTWWISLTLSPMSIICSDVLPIEDISNVEH